MNKHEAIYATHSNVVTIRGDDAFDAQGNLVTYDESAVQAYIDAHVYIAKRQQAYPSIADQLDLIYHQGLDAWKLAIQAVKDQYPKG
jgi:hypothetical protein